MRKRRRLCLALVLTTASLIAQGCSREDQNETAARREDEQKRGHLQTLTDGMTGRQAGRAGQKAQEQIREIAEQRNKDREEL